MAQIEEQDATQRLQAQVREAYQSKSPLRICGNGSKNFYGRAVQGDALQMASHRGIISYEPTELVITARAGCRLSEIEALLAEHGQMLGFEPPHFADNATLGGTIATNFSGPRRPYTGAARDYVLGSRIINGKGEVQKFGGEVMKNVAGYDVSRLMCGSLGTLGAILDVSLKVIPLPEAEHSFSLECGAQQALDHMHRWMLQSLPLSASAYVDGRLYVRLASNEAAIKQARQQIGGDTVDNDFWRQLKEQQLDFFNSELPLWRLSLASSAPPLNLQGDFLYDWGGALRWLRSDTSADKIRHALEAQGGHAILFKNNPGKIDPFHELNPAVLALHRQLQQAFDPANILNPQRMYAEI
jgi:glycolate oxidase FAD binding subunit